MSNAAVKNINAALSRVGMDPIETVADGSTEANLAIENYEKVVQDELCSAPWKFARQEKPLSHLATSPQATQFSEAWQLPTDFLMVRAAYVGVSLFPYELRDNELLCDFETGVRLVYTYRAHEQRWPGDFVEAIIRRLEAHYLRSKEQYVEAEKRDEAADTKFRMARTRHSQEEPGQERTPVYPLIAARRTGSAPQRRF